MFDVKARHLHLRIKVDIQKIDSFIFETFEIIIVSFSIDNKVRKS